MEKPPPAPPVFPHSWSISGAKLLADTPTSRVWEVTRAGGELAIVKDLKPLGVKDELTGILFLEWRNGTGAVRVLGRDGKRVLMEHAGCRTLAGYLEDHGDTAASEIAAVAIGVLHSGKSRLLPNGLPQLRERFKSLFAKANADRNDRAQSPYTDAALLAEDLLTNQKDVRPLHGDLHHENLICGKRGWLAIDAKGILGDPAYETANLFCNPLDRRDLCENPERVASLARLLARTLKQDEKRVLQYGFVHACLSAAWYMEGGNLNKAEDSLAVARAVRQAMS